MTLIAVFALALLVIVETSKLTQHDDIVNGRFVREAKKSDKKESEKPTTPAPEDEDDDDEEEKKPKHKPHKKRPEDDEDEKLPPYYTYRLVPVPVYPPYQRYSVPSFRYPTPYRGGYW